MKQISHTAQASREVHRAADGRFGNQPAAESDIDLDDTLDDLDQLPPEADWSFQGGPEGGGLPPEELLSLAQKYARIEGRRYNVRDVDELAGETLEHYFKYVRNRQAKVSAGAEPTPQYNVEGYMRRVANGLGQRYSSGFKHGGRDLTAVKRYLRTREAFEDQHGRAMTQAEEDELAEQIRRSAPPGKRPVENFHRKVSAGGGLSLDELRETRPGFDLVAEQGPQVDPGNSADSALADLDMAQDRAARQQVKQAIKVNIWAHMTGNTDAPQPVAGRHTKAEASKVRRACIQAGGVTKLIDDYEHDRLSSQNADVLFAPWGGRELASRSGDRLAICQVLGASRDYSEQVWKSALDNSTTGQGQ